MMPKHQRLAHFLSQSISRLFKKGEHHFGIAGYEKIVCPVVIRSLGLVTVLFDRVLFSVIGFGHGARWAAVVFGLKRQPPG